MSMELLVLDQDVTCLSYTELLHDQVADQNNAAAPLLMFPLGRADPKALVCQQAGSTLLLCYRVLAGSPQLQEVPRATTSSLLICKLANILIES